MNRTRWIIAGIAAALIAGGAALILLAPRDSAKESSVAISAPERTARAETPLAASADKVKDEAAEATAEAPAVQTASAFPSATARRERVGRGRAFGKASLPAEAGRGMEISIALHRVPGNENADFTYDDSLVAETTAAATDGAYEFTELPYGDYVLLATATGYTINGFSRISAERPEDETTLNLVPGGGISGRVVDQQHEPVNGAHIFVAAWDIQGQKLNAPRERSLASQRRSDENGNFTITNLRKSLNNEPGYRLAVKAEGFATFLSDYLQAGAQGAEFVLKPGCIVSGVLLSADNGEPLAEKTITIDSEIAVENLSAKTDAEGFFFLQDVPPGMQTASLRDEELVITPESAKFQVAAEGSTDDLILQAAAGGKISGRVYNAETGEGIAGVELFINAIDFPESQRLDKITGADGAYQFKGLRTGAYRVRHQKPEGYPQPRGNEEERRVSAAVGTETKGVDFPLSRGLTIAGRAVDEEGKPVPQASINAHEERGNAYDYTQTKDDGTFVLAGFSAGQSVQISGYKQGYAVVSTEPKNGKVPVEEFGAKDVRIILGHEASISGVVVDSAGQPKGRVEVHAQNTEGRAGSSGTTNADGTVKIGQLGPGEYYFIFPVNGMWSDSGPGAARQKVKIAKGEALTGVKILYDDPAGSGKLSIAGRVTDTQGKPISGATIMLNGMGQREERTDGNGNYKLSGLAEGQYSLQVFSYAHSAGTSKTATAGDTGVDFVLKGLATIEGRVVSADTNQAVTSFRVRAGSNSGQYQYYTRDQFLSVQDPQGRFKLTSVPDGATELEVRAEGLADTKAALTGVVGGETRRDVVVRMEGGVELAGRVVDASGKGVSGAQIFLGPAPEEWRRQEQQRASSASDGSFRLSSLSAGQTVISAAHAKLSTKSVTVNLVPRVENKVEIVLTSGGVVEGTVTLNGKPIAGANVNASTPQGGEQKQAETDAAGHYRIAGLPDGQIHMNPYLQNAPGVVGRGKSAQVQVSDGYVTELNFNFVSGTSTIEGVVYDAPGKPLSARTHVSLNMQMPDGTSEYMGAQTDANGAFLFEGVAAGPARLSAYVEGRNQSKVVNVTVGERQRIQRDILLYGGATLRISVSGGLGGNAQTIAYVFSGTPEIKELSMEMFQNIGSQPVGYADIQNGEGTTTGLEAGIYTVLVASFNPTPDQVGTDPFASAKWATQVVELPQDKEVSIRVSL